MDDASTTVTLVALIARAIRDELGEEIDAYPAGRDPDQADPMNRAFHAVAAALINQSQSVTSPIISTLLRRVAADRLALTASTCKAGSTRNRAVPTTGSHS